MQQLTAQPIKCRLIKTLPIRRGKRVKRVKCRVKIESWWVKPISVLNSDFCVTILVVCIAVYIWVHPVDGACLSSPWVFRVHEQAFLRGGSWLSAQKIVQADTPDETKVKDFFDLLLVVNSRLLDAQAVLWSESLEAWSQPVLPEQALETLIQIVPLHGGYNIFLTHAIHRRRLANGVFSLMQARGNSQAHTELWEYLILESSLFSPGFEQAKAYFQSLGPARAGVDAPYDTSAVVSLKNTLKEYRETATGYTEYSVARLLGQLDDLLMALRPYTTANDDGHEHQEDSASA
ncbi:hypothetical protein C8R46DRAFT_1037700 [Mycena filopes]|nr:hypothetical protein C8R46DRAFT_1037700 [Mycena filopes]